MSSGLAVKSNAQEELIREVSVLVNRLTGIQLGEKQVAMVQSRLAKRMIELKMTAPEEYMSYLRANQEKESSVLVSLLTTHHTFFFREFAHFDFLEATGLPKVVETLRAEGRKHIRVWSAACSMGQEVYSLSMFLAHHMRRIAPDFTYEFLGTDIDPESVNIAKNGVYKWDEIKEIPAVYLGQHWARGTGEISAFVKAKPSIKQMANFRVANLTALEKEPSEQWDIIFCRNVLIYFNQEQIQQITRQLLKRLHPKGYLFLGISESLMGLDVPVNFAGPSIYVHKAPGNAPLATVTPISSAMGAKKPGAPSPVPAAPAQSSPSRIYKVLCVDDSPVILSMLKKILTPDQGFEVVATAANGKEAEEQIRKHKIDLMTLDIHMPEMTGIEYLKKNFGMNHPPVIMVTSVSREDSELGLKALEIGARDFVEKPSMSNLSERADELRMKLRCAARSRQDDAKGMVSVSQSFARKPVILNPERKARVLVAGISDREKVAKVLAELRQPQCATYVLFHGGDSLLAGLAPQMRSPAWPQTQVMGPGMKLEANGLYVGDFSKGFDDVKRALAGKRVSLLIFGDVTKDVVNKVSLMGPSQLVVEELAGGYSDHHKALQGRATDLVPVTTFAYASDVYLSKDL